MESTEIKTGKVEEFTDIIIPCYNQIEYTKACIKSVQENTVDYRLIIIDNASTDGTAEYLKTFSNQDNVKIITNKDNLGFVRAINQGLKESKGNVVLLNNDTEVPPLWLDTLLDDMKKTGFGMLGTLSTSPNQPHHYFKTYKQAFTGEYISFFCTLIDKEVIKKVGFLDENIEMGLGDDNDYCRRARKAGFPIGLSSPVIKHHHRTTIKTMPNMEEVQKKNIVYLLKKWPPMKIMLAIPHMGNLRAELTQRLLTMQNYTFGNHLEILLSHKRPITYNRNYITNMFLKSGNDYLLQVDSDIMPPANILLMADNELDICSADIKSRNEDGIYRLALENNPDGKIGFTSKRELKHGLNKVDVTGTGCLMVKREVFEKMEQPYFFIKWDKGLATMGQDFHFCKKAGEAGFKVYYDMRYTCIHYQTIPF